MRLALLLPDGVGVRNFVHGGFVEEAARRGEVHAFTTAAEHVAEQPDLASANVHWRRPPVLEQGAGLRFLRQTLLYAHMHWAGTVSMRHNLSRPLKGSWRNRLFHRAARSRGRRAATPERIARLEQTLLGRVRQGGDYDAWKEILSDLEPDVLMVSNQKAPAIVPAAEAARSLGVPTATFVFSWDNLTSKGRIAVPFDHYLVWSDLMGEELRRYYPHVNASNVHVVGTPQFAPAADARLHLSREAFFAQLGADPARPLVCYSAAVPDTVPEEPLHVRKLLELVEAGAIHGEPQVLVRPAPTDTDDERWASLRRDFPDALFRRPSWSAPESGVWTDCLPTKDDVAFLANLTRHADLNVNIASTMTLDFALQDTPVVNVAFDVVSPPTFGKPLAEHYYRFDHYQHVLELGATRVAHDPQELAEHVNAYLEDPSLDRQERRDLVALEVGVPPEETNTRIVEVLERLQHVRDRARLLPV